MFKLFKKPNRQPSGCDYIFVGLGNPGLKYHNSRHNAGFMALDYFAERHNCEIRKMRFKGVTGECKVNGKKLLLLKPSTFMNLSGQSVVEAMNFYKLPPENVLVFFDDITLPPGKIRIRRKGSDGGQNGIKNIIYLSGSDNFPRIKIGVGSKPHPDYDLSDWVLSKFTGRETKDLEKSLLNASQAAEIILDQGIDEAMSQFNGI